MQPWTVLSDSHVYKNEDELIRRADLRIKSLIRSWPLTCSFARKPFLTCVFLFRLFPTVHGCFWLARGFFVGWMLLRRPSLLADEHANRSRAGANRHNLYLVSREDRFKRDIAGPLRRELRHQSASEIPQSAGTR
jgi:hypothetical protein